MELTWLEKAEARGEARGEVKERSRLVDRMRQAVLRSIEERFGEVPERVLAKVRTIRAPEPLIELAGRVPIVKSADDLLSRRRQPRN